MTYNEAYDKIIQAYFKDEIHPANPMFCFCGNLCDNTQDWFGIPLELHRNSHGYKGQDFVRMESALFGSITNEFHLLLHDVGSAEYEDALFAGMSAALEVLKQIHRERGEDVDSVPVFTKRQLVS